MAAFDSNQLLWMGNQQGNLGVDGDLLHAQGARHGAAWGCRWCGWPSSGLLSASCTPRCCSIRCSPPGPARCSFAPAAGWAGARAHGDGDGLLFGLATMAWPYTQGYFSDPVCGWGLFAAAYGLLAYAQSGRKLYLFGAGIAWGIAYLTRTDQPDDAADLPGGAVFGAGCHHAAPARQSDWQARLRAAFWRNWRPVVSLHDSRGAGRRCVSLWWNWVRFGSLWIPATSSTETFSGNWLFGLFGSTIGPARGFIWYNPILLLAIPGAVWFWRHQRTLLLAEPGAGGALCRWSTPSGTCGTAATAGDRASWCRCCRS